MRWFEGAVIYQVFPDRFAPSTGPKGPPRRVRGIRRWSDVLNLAELDLERADVRQALREGEDSVVQRWPDSGFLHVGVDPFEVQALALAPTAPGAYSSSKRMNAPNPPSRAES